MSLVSITFVSLKCVKQEDYGDDGDEIRLILRTNDHKTVVIFKAQMKKGQTKRIGKSFATVNIHSLKLVDKDSSTIFDPDDNLGVWKAPFKTTYGREKEKKFTGDDAHYVLTYTVD